MGSVLVSLEHRVGIDGVPSSLYDTVSPVYVPAVPVGSTVNVMSLLLLDRYVLLSDTWDIAEHMSVSFASHPSSPYARHYSGVVSMPGPTVSVPGATLTSSVLSDQAVNMATSDVSPGSMIQWILNMTIPEALLTNGSVLVTFRDSSMLRDVDLVSVSSHPAASLVGTTSSCNVADVTSVSAIAAADVSTAAEVRVPMCMVLNLDRDNAQADILEMAIAARLRNDSAAVVRGVGPTFTIS